MNWATVSALRVRPFHWVKASLAGWTWKHHALAFGLGMLTLSNMGAAIYFGPDFPWLRSLAYNVVQFGYAMVVAFRLADAAIDDGMNEVLCFTGAAVSVPAIGVWVIGPALYPVLGGDANWNVNNDLMLAFTAFLPIAMCAMAYAHWSRGMRLQKRLQSLALKHAQQERHAQTTRLLALQARVEPQLLFDALTRVRDGVDANAKLAEGQLHDLIALLRVMQPHSNAASSTLGRELCMAELHARVNGEHRLQAPLLSWSVPIELMQAEVMPMLLLPLLKQVVMTGPEHAAWRLEISMHEAPALDAKASPVLEWRLSQEGPARHQPVADLSELEQLLQSVHGPEAQLHWSQPGQEVRLRHRTQLVPDPQNP
jgi:hypothetical protein